MQGPDSSVGTILTVAEKINRIQVFINGRQKKNVNKHRIDEIGNRSQKPMLEIKQKFK